MTILFYPDLPRETNRVWESCKALGYKFHNNPNKPFHVVFFWSYTKMIWYPDKFYQRLLRDKEAIINDGCRNIRKDYVETVFEAVFGYSSCIDPRIYKGTLVEKTVKQDCKNEINFVVCPLKKKKHGFIYQKFIKTGLVDIRVFVACKKMQFVITKHKEEFIFQRKLVDSKFYEPSEIFNKDEITKINRFIESFSLDFGELDILRDEDGIIYVIDVNNIAGHGAFRYFEEPKKTEYKNRFHQTFQNTISKYLQDAY